MCLNLEDRLANFALCGPEWGNAVSLLGTDVPKEHRTDETDRGDNTSSRSSGRRLCARDGELEDVGVLGGVGGYLHRTRAPRTAEAREA